MHPNNPWIAVTERLPLECETLDGRVPAIDEDGYLVVAILINGKLHCTSDLPATHWLPTRTNDTNRTSFDSWLAEKNLTQTDPVLAARDAWSACAEICASALDLSPSQIRLMAGEMTAQEMRTVRAILSAISSKIRRN